MVNVVFVGDAPSKTNVSDNIPFVGSRSFTTLVEWIKVIKPDYHIVFNANNLTTDEDDEVVSNIHKLSTAGFKVVALGKEASKTLYENNIRHYEMPHPSGLNRVLNKKDQVQTALKLAHDYVRI